MSEQPDTQLVGWLTFVAALGGLLFGYDTAVISGAVTSIDINFIAPLHLSETARNSLSGFAVSSALFGCIVGAAVSGLIADVIGRRGGLRIAAAAYLLSAIGAAVPEIGLGAIGHMGAQALAPFICYRIIGGFGVGLASMLSPLYIAEIAPKARRGRLVAYNQLAIVVGITVVYFVNWFIADQGDIAWLHATGWRLMFASQAALALVFLISLLFVPETPRWLVLKGRAAEAGPLLTRLAGPAEAAESFAEIGGSLSHRRDRLFAFGVPIIATGVMVAVFQQVVGINAVTYYAPLMFNNMGASDSAALLQTISVGAALTVSTILTILTVDRLGRKPLLIAGALLMAVAMGALGLQFQAGAPGVGALIAVLLYMMGFGLSWGPIAWILLSEMYPNSIKGGALALAVAADWIANFGVTWSFRIIDGNSALVRVFHHGFPYYIYAAMSLLAALFVVKYLPETKGKSLESIQALWAQDKGQTK